MKDFFDSMNFPRWVILLMTIAALVLGFFVYRDSKRLAEIQDELARAPQIVKEIQELALQLDSLQGLSDKEGLKGEKNPDLYIRQKASLQEVQIGQVTINPSTTTPFRGVEDRRYSIKPSNKDAEYQRSSIANFLYKLESDSRRVKVTRIKVNPARARRVKPGEIGEDEWTFEAEITSRQVVEN